MATHVFVHLGDTHLQHGHPRNPDRLAALDQIIRRGLETPRLAAWLWPGDVFHAKSTPEDRNAVAVRLQQMAHRAPVLICPGNHDQPGDLEIFEKLDADWPIRVVTTPGVVQLGSATRQTIACAVLPYPHKAGLVAAGVEHAALGDAAAQAFDAFVLTFTAELGTAVEIYDAIPLFIGHVNVGGAIASVGQPQIGREIELHPSHLARLGPIAKALNHIHKHQEIHGAVYAGSITRQDYGEMEAKGYVEWTYDDVTGEWSWRFVEIETAEQLQIEGRLTRDGFEYANPDGRTSWAGADIRVRYRYVKAEVGALDVAHIHAEFAGCRSLKLDPVPELEHQVRAPEIAAAVTLEEKVQAYAARHGIAWTPAMALKLALLQAHDEQALVAAVTQSLAVMTLPAAGLRLEPEPAVA